MEPVLRVIIRHFARGADKISGISRPKRTTIPISSLLSDRIICNFQDQKDALKDNPEIIIVVRQIFFAISRPQDALNCNPDFISAISIIYNLQDQTDSSNYQTILIPTLSQTVN